MIDSNEIHAARIRPHGTESPRITRRKRAIELVEGNDDILPFQKIKLIKLFTHDQDKVETAVLLENLPYGTSVMKDWADESI